MPRPIAPLLRARLRHGWWASAPCLALGCPADDIPTPPAASDGPTTQASATSADTDSATAGFATTGAPTTTGDTHTTSNDDTDSSGGPPSDAIELRLLTNQNRAYARMHGGWGPHLRGLMRDSAGTLWFCEDAGPDVLTNETIRYLQLHDDAWSTVAEQPHLPGVQQNSACLLSNDIIFTYSVNVATLTLEECYFDTTDHDYRACNTITIGGPFNTPPLSNYVGAALGPDDARVVWYSTVDGAAHGTFTYTTNFGGGWNGPVVWPLPDYDTFAYVRASFAGPSRIVWNGQMLDGEYPDGTLVAAIAEANIGRLPIFRTLSGDERTPDPLTGADIWVDPISGHQHAIAQASPRLGYYHRPPEGTWVAHEDPLHWFDDTFRARWAAPAGGGLALIRGSASGENGVDIRWVEQTNGPIDWDDAVVMEVDTSPAPGLGRPSAIYVEANTYQSAEVDGIEFALCGAYGESDTQIWHGRAPMP